jgi:hypothetical protein
MRDSHDPEGPYKLHIDVIDDYRSLCELKHEWDAVYDADPESQLFLSWMWMSKWFGDVIKPWIVLAACPEGGSHVAFYPLRIYTLLHKNGGFYNEIQVACQATADYTGFICRPEHEDAAISAFAECLTAIKWGNLDLRYFSASDRRLKLFQDKFPEREFKIKTPGANPAEGDLDYGVSLYVDLPESWEAYLSEKLSAKTRQRVRNYLRKVENGDRFRITHADRDTIERDFDILGHFWG